VLKTVLDQILWRPLLIWYGFVSSGLLSGRPWKEVKATTRQNLVKVIVTSWKIWPLIMFLTQKFLPPLYQSTALDGVSFFWDIYEALLMSSHPTVTAIKN
ncbi:unnamed protein product, partial [Polarella glacialis]